jgi:hypothetical protein
MAIDLSFFYFKNESGVKWHARLKNTVQLYD